MVQCSADSHTHGLFPHSFACPYICLINKGDPWRGQRGRGGGEQVPLVVLQCLRIHVLVEFGAGSCCTARVCAVLARIKLWSVAAGLHTSAFFFGHAAMHMIDILVQPAIFMSLYYTLTLPEIKFLDYYIGKLLPSAIYCSPSCVDFCDVGRACMQKRLG